MRGARGFSIPELLVASTLSIVVAGWMITAYIAGYTNWERARIRAELQQTASIYMQRVLRGMQAGDRNGLQEAESFTIIDGGQGIRYECPQDTGDWREFTIFDDDGDITTTDDNYLVYGDTYDSTTIFVKTRLWSPAVPASSEWLRNVTFNDNGTTNSLIITILLERSFRGQDITTELRTMVFLRN